MSSGYKFEIDNNLLVPVNLSDTTKQVPLDGMVEHHVLSISEFSHIFTFGAKPPANMVKVNNINDYALTVARNNHDLTMEKSAFSTAFEIRGASEEKKDPGRPDPTLFDLKFDHDAGVRWILIELRERTNWRFIPGSPGASKKLPTQDEDHTLCFATSKQYYVPQDGSGKPIFVPDLGSPANPEICRVLYWGVARRPAPPNTCRGFNFWVEFYQDVGGGEIHTIPTIFDPNVPNDGGPQIP